jgi:hypothetical protein
MRLYHVRKSKPLLWRSYNINNSAAMQYSDGWLDPLHTRRSVGCLLSLSEFQIYIDTRNLIISQVDRDVRQTQGQSEQVGRQFKDMALSARQLMSPSNPKMPLVARLPVLYPHATRRHSCCRRHVQPQRAYETMESTSGLRNRRSLRAVALNRHFDSSYRAFATRNVNKLTGIWKSAGICQRHLITRCNCVDWRMILRVGVI